PAVDGLDARLHLPPCLVLPEHRARRDRDALAGQSDRRQGRRRSGRHREHCRGGQCRRRRTQSARDQTSRHALHGADGLAGHPVREGRPGVIPAAFDYRRPTSVDEALKAISGGDAKVIAGGQSILPLLKMRLASADTLVDIGRLADLRGMRELPDGGYEVGALTTYADIISGTKLAWVADAVEGIGDVQVRNRGTVGGSISHCDPASDLPAVALALDYSVVLRSDRGERTTPL